jgi:integrase
LVRQDAGRPPDHARSLLFPTETILETARIRDRLIDSNPRAIRGAGTAERKIKPKPATLEQLNVIVEEMPENLRLMVLLATRCAMRFGELVALQRGDVDLGEEIIRIRRAAVRVDKRWEVGNPKSEAGIRDVAISPHIMPAVKNHLSKHVGGQHDALLFPARNGGHLQPSTFQRHYYRAGTRPAVPT